MAINNSIPAATISATRTNLTSKTEQQLKIRSRADYITSQLLLTTNVEARASFESELTYLREQYGNMLPDAVVVARVERLQALRKSLNLRTIDNRRQYQAQTTRAVSKLCGGAV